MMHSAFSRPEPARTLFRIFLNQFVCESNYSRNNAARTGRPEGLNECSGGGERERVDWLFGIGVTVRAAGAASLGAGTEGLVDDRLDGLRASSALGAAAETAINLLGIARHVRSCVDGIADIVVAKDVTGTNNHDDSRPTGDIRHHRYWSTDLDAKGKTALSSNSKLTAEALERI